MNRIYRLVWSRTQKAWIPVSESSGGLARGGNKSTRSKLLVASLTLCSAIAQANPSGGVVTAGSGSIAQTGHTTTIHQDSQNLSLNWQSFNIAAKDIVNFVQPSASAIAVNRIFDTSATQILGQLHANGQVYLINPNGIVFGQGSQVNVGGLVASTLDVNDASLNSANKTFSGTGTGSIVNKGNLVAVNGRYIALLANQVSNQGIISAQLGTVALAAGSAITLTFADNSLVQVHVNQSTLNNLAENKQLVVANGGQVFMDAGAKASLLASVVNNTGIIEAQTVSSHDGVISLLGGMEAGTVNVAGTLDASAPNAGNGGAIETSAAHVVVANEAKITTAAKDGKTGSWLIDPTNFTIVSGSEPSTGSGIGATTLQNELASSNITIATSATDNGDDLGDINVNAPVNWSANQLTLTAANNIKVNATMNVSGTATLAMNTGTNGAVNTGFGSSGAFLGSINFAQSGQAINGNNLLTINGNVYTVINTLGLIDSTTATDLQGINGNLYGNYALGSNIDASNTSSWNSGAGFTPIGPVFAGVFNGLGHTLSNLTINIPTIVSVGLFASTSGTAPITNIGIISENSSGITGAASTGGLVGDVGTGGISNSFNTESVTGAAGTGGLAGTSLTGNISNSYATGAVIGNAGTGGLVGTMTTGSVDNSYAIGNVTGDASTGGLVGSMASGNVSSSYAAASSITGAAGTGGLVGSMTSGNILNSYASVINLTGAAGTGGLVGSITSGTVTTSYASVTGTIAGAAGTGGLIGATSAAVNYSFFDTTAIPTSVGTMTGGGGMSTANMKVQNNFTSSTSANGYVNPNWDFSTIWGINPAINGGNPYLLSIPPIPQTTTIYLDLIPGSSIYGSAPAFSLYPGPAAGSYIHISGSTGYTVSIHTILPAGTYVYNTSANYLTGTIVTNANPIGTIAWSGAPTNISNVMSSPYSVSYSSGITLGNSAYTLAAGNAASWSVTPANLTLSGTKVYDGNTTLASRNLTATGINGQTFSVNGTGANDLITANVQSGKLANVTNLWLGASSNGGLSSNYKALSKIGSSVSVTKANLTLSGTEIYNGTNAIAGSKLIATGVNGQTFRITGTGATDLSTANVQSGTQLANVTNLRLGFSSNGGLSRNYNVLSTVGSLVNVTKANLNLIGTEVYNGTNTLAGSKLTAKGVNGETFTVNGTGINDMATANVQTKTQLANVNDLTIGTGNTNAALASNYNPLSTLGSSVSVTPAILTVTADNQTKSQGFANPVFSETISGFVNGETKSVVTGKATGSSTATKTSSKGTVAIKARNSGLSASNYIFSNLVNGTLTIK